MTALSESAKDMTTLVRHEVFGRIGHVVVVQVGIRTRNNYGPLPPHIDLSSIRYRCSTHAVATPRMLGKFASSSTSQRSQSSFQTSVRLGDISVAIFDSTTQYLDRNTPDEAHDTSAEVRSQGGLNKRS